VRWDQRWHLDNVNGVADDGVTLYNEVRVDRRSLIAGLFHGIQGMHVGGTRLLRIAPHLAYGTRGVDGLVPPNAAITVELSVTAERYVEGQPETWTD
jgi:hypothetical protein